MPDNAVYILVSIVFFVYLLRKIQIRLRLSKAKHPSLRGHAKMSRRVSKLIPFYEYNESRMFSSDSAPGDVSSKRQTAFQRLANQFKTQSPISIKQSEDLEDSISDVLFTNHYRVPFQFRNYVRKHMKIGTLMEESSGTRIKDMDGNWSYDLTGSYGVNVFGYDFYKECINKGSEKVQALGPVLGAYHPIIADNVKRLKDISGLDEVSFHMSGTEAVMQAVRLARFHTGKTHLVQFCGSYHGWWDGVQPGIGNDRKTNDVYTLKENDKDTLKVLRTRTDIACVLINPLQALHINSGAPGDAMLVNSERSAHYDRQLYADWLKELRKVCSEKSIVLIFDEIFVGFRLAFRGAQEYFGVKADMVTYGKTLGGGLPVGVVCGKHQYMKRFKDNRPTKICFARGTFNSHPYVMGAMNEFLLRVSDEQFKERHYTAIEVLWNKRVEQLNSRLKENDLPVRIVNMVSIWTILFDLPSRYNWMFQYYLRSQGLAISWIGSGRLIMSHNYTDDEYEAVCERIVNAAREMKADDWWWQSQALTNKSIKRQVLKEIIFGH